MDTLKKRLADVLEWKNLTVEGGYKNAPVQVEEMFAWLEKYGTFFASFVCNTTEYLSDAMNDGKSIIFEAQLGALRDIDLVFIHIHQRPQHWQHMHRLEQAHHLQN